MINIINTNINKKRGSAMVGISIIVAGLIVAGAVLFTKNDSVPNSPQAGTPTQHNGGNTSTDNVREVTSDDHILGNPNAAVKIVEYSDFECPFCNRLHGILNQVISEYGEDGDVAWVFRHFPLDQLHPRNARKVAVASECVAEIAGESAFWEFSNEFFANSPANDRTDLNAVIPPILTGLGVDQSKFDECAESGRHDDKIQADIDNAVATGGRGTPWSVVIGPNGETFPLSGAQPIEAIRQIIEVAKVQ